MLERFHRIAQRWTGLRPVAAVLSVAFLVTSVVIVLLPHSREANLFLIPSLLGFVWALSAYVFLTGFLDIPRKATPADKLLVRIKLSLSRSAYWGMGFVFLTLTALSLILSLRMAGIWLNDYLG